MVEEWGKTESIIIISKRCKSAIISKIKKRKEILAPTKREREREKECVCVCV